MNQLFRYLHIFLFCGVLISNFSFLYGQNKQSNFELEKTANKIVAQADELTKKDQYSKAVLKLIPIVDYYPEYSKIDNVMYKLGNNLTEMGLYDSAFKIYRHLVENNPQSSLIPFAIFGIEKLHYMQKDYERAIDYFRLLREKFPDAQTGDGPFYYAGQSFLFQDDFENALLTFDAIEERSEFWGFALYSHALANFKKKKLMRPFQT